MIALLQGLLPGFRSLRAPIFGGLLWSIFVWLIAANSIPSKSHASGWISQVYALVGLIGPVGLGVLATLAIFIIGAATQAITQPISQTVGYVTNGVLRIFGRYRGRSISRNIEDAIRAIRRDELRVLLSTSNSEGPLVPFDSKIFAELPQNSGKLELENRLFQELASDPLELVRLFDKDAFDEFQRERGERGVRLAISFPTIAIGVLLGFQVSVFLGIGIAAIGFVMMLRYSADLTEERTNVLNLLLLRGGNTPALNSVRTAARYDLAEYRERLKNATQRQAQD